MDLRSGFMLSAFQCCASELSKIHVDNPPFKRMLGRFVVYVGDDINAIKYHNQEWRNEMEVHLYHKVQMGRIFPVLRVQTQESIWEIFWHDQIKLEIQNTDQNRSTFHLYKACNEAEEVILGIRGKLAVYNKKNNYIRDELKVTNGLIPSTANDQQKFPNQIQQNMRWQEHVLLPQIDFDKYLCTIVKDCELHAFLRACQVPI